jgi:hypothetical protein
MKPDVSFRHFVIGAGMIKSGDIAVALMFRTDASDFLLAGLFLAAAWLGFWAAIWKVSKATIYVRPADDGDAR